MGGRSSRKVVRVAKAAPKKSAPKKAAPKKAAPKKKVAARAKTGPQYVFAFGGGKAEGNAGMKNLLGGKGANLAEMANLGWRRTAP